MVWPVDGLDFGVNFADCFARYDRNTQSWKTWQTSLLEDWATFSATWPRSGWMRGGMSFQLPTLAHRSLAIGSGLLPTLVAGDSKGGRNGTSKGRSPKDGMTMTDWLWLNVGHGRLHPESAEWMMGYPEGWTALEPSEMPSPRRSRKSSGGQS